VCAPPKLMGSRQPKPLCLGLSMVQLLFFFACRPMLTPTPALSCLGCFVAPTAHASPTVPLAVLLFSGVAPVVVVVVVVVVHQVFRSFGDLRRVVIFAKNEQFCALVELESEPAAVAALAALDSQFIYPYVLLCVASQCGL
jgi:hypothetical protein